MSSSDALGPFIEKLNDMMLATQYEPATDLIVQFLKSSGEKLSLTEQFYLRGLRCFCLYHNRDYEMARDTVMQLLEERDREGERDLNYVYDIRTLALAQRGLCQFDECDRLLKAILKQVKQISEPSAEIIKVISELEEEIENSEKVRRNEPIEVFTLNRIELTGPFGVQTLGIADLEIPKDQAVLNCEVHRLALTVENFYRFALEIEFSLDNQLAISNWTIRSDHVLPIVLAVILPRGAKVHHGDFDLRLGKKGTSSTHDVRLQNHFFTILHPDSYNPRSRHPIPICKTFRYIKADCSVFQAPIPQKPQIRFKGWIEFPQLRGDCKEQTILRKFWLLFPYGHVLLPKPEYNQVETEDSKLVSVTWNRTAFHTDQTGFRAGDYEIAGPGPEPILGAVSPIAETELKTNSFSLSNMDMFAWQVKMVPKKTILATVRPLTSVIPVGIFNYLPLLNARKDPDSEEASSFDLTEEELSIEKRRRLATLLVENYSGEPHSLKVSIDCASLGLRTEEVVNLVPWERVSVPLIPSFDQSAPMFQGWQSDADLAQAIRDCPIQVTVLEQKQGKPSTTQELESKTSYARALPPDFMVWAISEPSDGRIIDLRLLLARWVTPRAAPVLKLLEASGLQQPTGDPLHDLKKVYKRLAALRIQYDMSSIVFGTEMEHRFQRIRTPTVTLTSRKMNCIDGCVLFASCMEAMGYRPVIVILRTHAIFGIIDGPLDAVERMLLLETTMVCRQSKEPFKFQDALARGRHLFEAHQGYFLADKSEQSSRRYSDGGFDLYRIVPIEQARQYGIEAFGDGDIPEFEIPVVNDFIPTPLPYSWANSDRAAQMNIEYQAELARWKALPFWQRLIRKKPLPPAGI